METFFNVIQAYEVCLAALQLCKPYRSINAAIIGRIKQR